MSDDRMMVLRQSGDGRSRLIERLYDGTFWAQEIYTDEQGRKCWRQAEVSREVANPPIWSPHVSLWSRLRLVRRLRRLLRR